MAGGGKSSSSSSQASTTSNLDRRVVADANATANSGDGNAFITKTSNYTTNNTSAVDFGSVKVGGEVAKSAIAANADASRDAVRMAQSVADLIAGRGFDLATTSQKAVQQGAADALSYGATSTADALKSNERTTAAALDSVTAGQADAFTFGRESLDAITRGQADAFDLAKTSTADALKSNDRTAAAAFTFGRDALATSGDALAFGRESLDAITRGQADAFDLASTSTADALKSGERTTAGALDGIADTASRAFDLVRGFFDSTSQANKSAQQLANDAQADAFTFGRDALDAITRGQADAFGVANSSIASASKSSERATAAAADAYSKAGDLSTGNRTLVLGALAVLGLLGLSFTLRKA